MPYDFFEKSQIFLNRNIINLLSYFDNIIYKIDFFKENAFVIKDSFFNNFNVSPQPISMIIAANTFLTTSYLLYFVTHWSITKYFIETMFNILYGILTINAIQVSIIYSFLDIFYYFRTSKFLLIEIYDSYNLKKYLENSEFTITYNIFILGCAFIAYVYPLILYIINKENINFISGTLSIFPLMILSMHTTSNQTFFCDYNNYLKKIDKPISKEESNLCNVIGIIVSLFFIFN
jgi:hypothetical protein